MIKVIAIKRIARLIDTYISVLLMCADSPFFLSNAFHLARVGSATLDFENWIVEQ
ncbi:hypothetical protein [Methylobacterium sp. J-076]|uniref:hypothetical protein n=1 Tax=Methylobacterium sp. J-076 TaxID=2836655 RepID=UPI001FBA1900|nr:hypothetical protein [Methylobacterium sp. J-076]